MDYLSTSEIATGLEKLFTDDVEKCKKLQSDIGKLFVAQFETNLQNEFSEVRRVIELSEDVTADQSGTYLCNDYTISNKLFELNQKYIKDNIDNLNKSAIFSQIFKNDPDFSRRSSFLSKVKFNLQGYGSNEGQYSAQSRKLFWSNLSLERESQCKQELDDIQTRKQAKESIEQNKQKQKNKNDKNNINNNTIEVEDDIVDNLLEENENGNRSVISNVTLKKIDIEMFAQGSGTFYCSESPEILGENAENKEEAKPNNNYPDYNEFKSCEPGLGLVNDGNLDDDNNPNFDGAPAITTLEETIFEKPNTKIEGDKIYTNEPENKSFG